jgi:fatty acid desaturase
MSSESTLTPVPRYRQILRKELPPHFLQPDNWHLVWFLPHTAIIGGSLWALSAFFTWWLAPILVVLIGHSMGCLGFLAHEICHGGAIKNKKLRHFLAGLAFSPFGIGPYLWSRWHNGEHHGNTQHRELDPDRLFLLEEYKESGILKWLYQLSPILRNIVIFGFFSVTMTQHNFFVLLGYMKDKKTTRSERATILFQFALPKVLWIGGTLLLGWHVLLLGYVVPLLIANAMVISYIATNHFLNPLADESDVLGSSLSVTLPRWLGWLDVMHSRFGAHVAHHLFPQAPSRYSRQIEEHIARLWPDRFHIMPLHKALGLLWNTPWVYDEPGTHLVNPRQQTKSPTLGNGLEP